MKNSFQDKLVTGGKNNKTKILRGLSIYYMRKLKKHG